MTTAALRNVALGVAAIGVFLATARLLPSAPQEDELRLSPAEVFPLQEVAIRGLPDELMGLGVRAVPLDAAGKKSGEAIPLYAVRLRGCGTRN